MIPEISPHDLEKLLDSSTDLDLIDVREPYEYREAHVRQARNIPLNAFLAQISTLDASTRPVYIICATGNRSGMAAMYCGASGKRATNIAGGTAGMIRLDSKYIVRGN